MVVVFIGREFDPRKLDDTASKEVANLPGTGIVAMPEQPDYPSRGPMGAVRAQLAHLRPSATP